MMWSGSIGAVRWVAENKRPFSIVADPQFRKLMKTGPGRTDLYIPSPATLARDVQKVFLATRLKVAAMLQVSQLLKQMRKQHLT